MSGHLSGTTSGFGAPRLEVRWQPRRSNFLENLTAAVRGARAAGPANGWESFFRFQLSTRRLPVGGIAGSFLWHIILLSISIPVSQLAEPAGQLPLPQVAITWYGPTTDVAPIVAPVPAKPKRPTPTRRLPKRPPVARAYNPTTTVIFQPPRPTNTRQVLIQPDAPPTPPKSLPSLPNVIAWVASANPKPTIPVNPRTVIADRPQPNASLANSQAPHVTDHTPPPGPLDLTSNARAALKPPFPIAPSAIHAVQPAPPQSASAPLLPAAPAAPNRLVALSLVPSGSLPPPPGNASAPISIGPVVGNGVQSTDAPTTDVAGAEAGIPGASNPQPAVPGPEGLVIMHDGAGPAAPPPAPAAGIRIPAADLLAGRPLHPAPGVPASRGEDGPRGGIFPHDLAHEILGYRPIHKLLINMPDLTSATGSWVLDFAALPGEDVPLGGDVVAPLPMVKVDPRYPPAVVEEKVEGEVVLYAIIDRDGAVDHIRVVKSLDPRLDANAEAAFARWKFRPALIDNRQAGLEVLVHIPFRISAPR